MIDSLLNAGKGLVTNSLILDIFIIIGVVVAGALIVYFVWEAIAAAMKKQKKEGVSDLYECTYDKIKTAKIMIKF